MSPLGVKVEIKNGPLVSATNWRFLKKTMLYDKFVRKVALFGKKCSNSFGENI
jgi:hypothetical protein